MTLIYTTIGIDGCSLDLDTTSYTAKPYILQKICFQEISLKFLGFWHGHDYFWPPNLLRLLEAKNLPLSPKMATKEWIFWERVLVEVVQCPQKHLSGSNQIWPMTSNENILRPMFQQPPIHTQSWSRMMQQHTLNAMLLLLLLLQTSNLTFRIKVSESISRILEPSQQGLISSTLNTNS